jgi:hypothetical protein
MVVASDLEFHPFLEDKTLTVKLPDFMDAYHKWWYDAGVWGDTT